MGERAVAAVALDFGGTLAEPGPSPSGRDVVAVLEHRLGRPSPAGLEEAVEEARAEAKAAYRRGVQTPWEVILTAAWRRLGLETPDLAAVVAALWRAVPDGAVDPRAARAVQALRGTGRTLVLACNTQRPVAHRQRTLAAAGLAGCFDSLVLSSDFAVAKPDPRFYAAVADAARGEAECPPEMILFVGDTVGLDVLGPRAFGMRAALVCSGPRPHGLPGDTPVITHVGELPDLLERWP
ncbi:FMN phosphatase YigB, HAD superfamily [Parafrankia irregularis]|uniref:FMN phosphatase YigB, HAD superfamily n=1 Tax=Parafrankia irregularis TaxID=795642 RepID=A0A0S4R074_9ACTN|nr:MULTISPECIES: HAD family hydrolase [Frankiaceae]MBE3204672.1 HAD family hydrolase [Parafrankia sp. CH37]CUU60610.1 FMN phosphatase YigB, HAD superfamily [Parafrankia irregularis]